jgi:hypothetical protein
MSSIRRRGTDVPDVADVDIRDNFGVENLIFVAIIFVQQQLPFILLEYKRKEMKEIYRC